MEDNEPFELEVEPVEIYSKLAVRGFSIFFAPIFGGALLMYNLRLVGKRKEAIYVLTFAILYTIFALVLINSNPGKSSLVYLLNIIGGVILSDFFYKKYFPENDYHSKPIWKALVISLLISLPFVAALFYSLSHQ